MVVHIEAVGNLVFKCFRTKRGNWIATCEPISLAVAGETYAELMEDIGLTLEAFLSDLHKNNELGEFAKSHGWKLDHSLPENAEDVRFDIPFLPELMHDPQTALHQ